MTNASAHSTYDPDFALHTLGWKAFQDLCSTVTTEILGQTVERYFDSHDGGRDGAFGGTWERTQNEHFSGAFTIQCKFTAKPNAQLNASILSDEIEKARTLLRDGLADTYLLITNASVKGTVAAKLKKLFVNDIGVKHFAAYGREWLSQAIRDSPRLRMLVPRVYGLGDLGQIFDERAYSQARAILSSMGDDLRTFVITDSYRRSTKAIVEHGFVLLLGEPAAGKSTIAAALAVGAIDQWQSQPMKIASAAEFTSHWNPNEPKQLFWVDDVFGPTQIDSLAATQWNQAFSHLQAAIRRGAKIIFTSRDYIYQAAREHLKEGAFPLILESQVVINVDALSQDEKSQILYNHMKLGRQPQEFKSAIKHLLPSVVSNHHFRPESARRLSHPLFTKTLSLNIESLRDFIEKPVEHLVEVIRTMDDGSRSALAAIFMREDRLSASLRLSDSEKEVVSLMGGSPSRLRSSLNAMNNSLVLLVREDGDPYWRFKHPTIRDAMAHIIAGDAALCDVYLKSSPLTQMLKEITCGKFDVKGVRLVATQASFDLVIGRLMTLDLHDRRNRVAVCEFIANRCSPAFVKQFVERHSGFAKHVKVEYPLQFSAEAKAFIKLYDTGVLANDRRKEAVSVIVDLMADGREAAFTDKRFNHLLTKEEYADAVQRIRDELLTDIDDKIERRRDDFFNDGADRSPESYFENLVECLEGVRDLLEDENDVIETVETAIANIEHTIEELQEERVHDNDDSHYDADRGPSTSERSIFDDIDL